MLAHKTNSVILKLLIVYNFNLLNFVRDQCKRILNSSLFNNMYNPFSFIHWIVQTVNEKNVQSFSLYSAFLWFIICLFFSLFVSSIGKIRDNIFAAIDSNFLQHDSCFH